mgnify:FL=1|jgi:hypothetical protein
MNFLLKIIPNKIKIWLLNVLYKDIAGKGVDGDTELAHINKDEARLLKLAGGSGTVNECTGLKEYKKGGGGGGAPAAPAQPANTTQTTFSREAPEIEARKLALYDEAIELSKVPIRIPEYEIAGASPLQQRAFQTIGTSGIGADALGEGILSTLGAQQTAMQQPDIDAFMNPYQRYVIDEINRQAKISENRLSAEAVAGGAFGGGREGVQRAEQERGRLAQIGQAQAAGFGTALSAAQRQQQFQTQAQQATGAQLANLGAQQQQMALTEAQAQLTGGQAQRDIAQQALTAQRQTEIARAYEPFQRIEFQKGIMTALPTAASQVTAGTGPGVNPLAQAAGAGLQAYAAYNIFGGTGIGGGPK